VGDLYYLSDISILVGFLLAIYATILESFSFTLGKLAMGIRVVNKEGGRPDFLRSLARNALRIVDSLAFIYLVGLLVARRSDGKQRVGDRLASTYVVVRPK